MFETNTKRLLGLCLIVFIVLFDNSLAVGQNSCGTTAPITQPTAIQFANRNQFGLDVNFTVDNAADAFLILRSTSSSPVDLSGLQTLGDVAIGTTVDNSVVVFKSQTRNAYSDPLDYNYGMEYSTTWAGQRRIVSYIYRESSLTPNTEYYYTILSFNACNLNSGGSPPPSGYQYNITSPLTGSTATCLATPDRTAISVSNRTGSSFDLTVPKITGASDYSIFAYTDHALSSALSGSPFNTTAFTTATGTISATGLPANSTIYYKVVANPTNSNVCSSAPSHEAYSYQFSIPGNLNSQYIDNKVIIGCPAPAQIPTNLVTTMQPSGVENYISASFTGTNDASGYIVVHNTDNIPPVIPDGNSKPSIGGYSKNININGTYYWVTSNTSATSVSNKSLGGVFGATVYTWVIPYTLCADGTFKFYNTTPLTNTVVACPSAPWDSWFDVGYETSYSFVTSYYATPRNYLIDVSTTSDFANPISNSPFYTNAAKSFRISGLLPSTTYYVRTSIVGPSCNSEYTITKSITTKAPVVSSVSTTDGTYLYNTAIDITVGTNVPITPVRTGGIPSIDVTVGSTVRQAVLVESSSSSSFTFRYIIQADEIDADGITLGNTINLNGGTLKDEGGNDLNLALNNVGATTSVLVDGIPGPVLSSLTLIGSNAGSSLSIAYTATFDKAVTGVTTNSFMTSNTGNVSAATITSISGSGTTYTINVSLTAAAVTASGTAILSLKTNQTSIVDGTNKALITTAGFTGDTYTYTPPPITIPVPTISTATYISRYFLAVNADRLGINFPITLPTSGTLPNGTQYHSASFNDAQIQFSFDGTNWTLVDNGNSYETFTGVAYKYIGNGTARSYQLMLVPISPSAPTVYVRARTKVEDAVNGTILYSDWTAANQLFSPPPPAVQNARLVFANGAYNVEITMDKYDANQSVVSFERKHKILDAASFTTQTIASSNSSFNSNGYGRGGASGTVYTNYKWNFDLNLTSGKVYQFEVTPIFANSVRGTTYSFAEYLSNGTNSVSGTSLNRSIGVNVNLANVLAQVPGATLVSTTYQFALFTAPSTFQYISSVTVAGTNASTTLSSNSNGALVNGSTYQVRGTSILSKSGVNFSVALASVDVVPNLPALTITGLTGANKEYDGDRTASATGTAVLNGVANGHSVTISGTPVYQFADATIGNGKAITVTGYTLSGTNAADYSLVQPTSLTGNITTKALTISGISGTNRPYNGLRDATLTGTAMLNGVIGSESVTLTSPSSFTFASAGVGNGIAITPASNFTISGTNASNYTLTQPTGLSANITEKGLTITGLTGTNKEYDGNRTVSVSGTAAYAGLENSETFSVLGTPSYSFADAFVGNAKPITTTGYLPPNANYTVSQPSITAAITAKSMSVTATGPIMTIGTALTSGTSSTNFTATGTIAGESVTSVTLTPNAAGLSSSTASGASYTVTPSLATGSGGFLASNYQITYNPFSGIVAGPPEVSSINRISGATTNATTLTYTVTFDKSVTGVDVSDFTLTASGASSASISSISGSAAVYTVSLSAVSGDGTIRLDLKNSGTGIQDIDGRAIISGFTAGQVYTIDQTLPTVTSITSSPGTGNKKAGDVIQILVNFSESVTVTNAPKITLETGSTDVDVSYTSGSGTNQLRFDYTVGAGQNSTDLDYVSSTSLALNGGTIGDAAGNAATLTLASPGTANSLGSNSFVRVDTQVPSGFDFTINQGSVTLGNQSNIGITMSGAEVGSSYTVVQTIGGSQLSNTGTISTSTDQISGLDLTNLADGLVTVSVTLTDAAGNVSAAVTKTISKDVLAPTVSSVTSTAPNGTYKAGQIIPIIVQFSEVVTVSGGTPTLTLETGTTDAVVNYSSGSGTTDLTFNYTVSAGNTSSTLNYVATNSLSLNGASIFDAGNNPADLTLPDLTTHLISSLAGASILVIDTQLPTLTAVSISSGNANATKAKVGDIITLSITASEVIDSPTITIAGQSATVSGNGTSWTATKTVASNTTNGTAAIQISYQDLAGNAGSTVTMTTNSSAVTVDTQLPTGYSFTIQNGPVTAANQTGISIALSGAEVGTTYSVNGIVGSTRSNGLVGSITTSATQVISNIDFSSFPDGNLDIELVLTDASGNSGAIVTQSTTKDALAPSVSSVTSSLANGSFKLGQVIPVIVNFSEAVIVTGTPQINLETGTTDAVVSYSSGSGTTALTFNYTVASGNTSSDLDYISTTALTLNGGTMFDVGNNAATLTLPAPGATGSLGANKSFIVDTTVPNSYGFSFGQASVTAANKTSISISLISAEVGTTLTANFTDGTSTIPQSNLVSSANQTISNIDLSSLADGTISGTLYLTDAAGNRGADVVQTLQKDAIAPSVSSVNSSLTNGSYPVGQVIPIIVTFTEPVAVTGTPNITLETGNTDAVVNYSSGTGTNSLTFNYTIASGQDVADLDYTSASSLTLNGGTILDAGSNAAALTLPLPGIVGSLGYNKNIVVDTQIPTIAGVSSSVANGAYKAGVVIPITVSFTENVYVTGAPTLSLSAGSPASASYASGSGTNVLTFNYTIAAGQTISDLDYSSTSALALNSGTIQDAAANNAILTLASPGSTGSLGNAKNIIVDTQTPSGYSISNTANITNANKLNSGFTFSNAEVGTSYTYTYSNGLSSVTGSGTVTSSTQVVSGIDVHTVLDGTVSLSVTLTDLAGNVGAAATASMNKFTNVAPTASPLPIVLNQNDPDQRINLLAGATDLEGDALSVNSVVISYSIKRISDNSNVTVSSSQLTKFADVVSPADLSNNELLIEMTKSNFLPGGQKGLINISYVITDGFNNVNTSNTLTIIGANDQPSGNALTVNQVTVNGQNMGIPLTEGVGITTNVPGVDPDDDSVIYTLDQNSQVSNGSFVFNADGSFAFVPNSNYFGEQQFQYYVKDASGIQNGPYLVKIIIAENPDIDGVPSKLEEIAPNNGDVNGDGIPDRKQNNITNLPLGSYADYRAGIDWANGVQGVVRPATSRVGSLIAGSMSSASGGIGGNAVDLDPNAKFRNVAILPAPQIQNSDRQFATDLYQFTIEGLLSNANDTTSARLPLRDLDTNRPGLQVRAILELPAGVVASTYLKQDAQGNWLSFKDDQNLATYDDGATLINLDSNPATIERIVLTFTDGAFGDNDRTANASISDPGGLGTIYPVIADATLSTRAEGVATNTLLRNINDTNSNADVDGEGQTITYSLDASNSPAVLAAVQIDPSSGALTVKSADAFDFESFVNNQGIATMQIVVKATDSDGFTDTAIITQVITNIDEFPRIISGRTVSYLENQATSVPVITVQTLPDYQDATTFSILSGLDGASFTINPTTGVLQFLQSPNFETKQQYTLDIQSIDLLGHTDHAVFTVNILDVDENNPARSTIASDVPMIFSDGTTAATITVTAYNATGVRVTDGGANVVINTNLGTISAVTDHLNGTYTATLTALNVYGRATVGFTINGNTGTATTQVNIRSIYDNDGDSVTDSDEIADGTDPNDGCSFNPAHVVLAYTSTTWQQQDCDGDGNPNGTDVGPLDYCVDGSGIAPQVGTPAYEYFRDADCDGDGISNGLECHNGGTNCEDFDQDGTPDYLDHDSDNDGVIDYSEKYIDSDQDGRKDYVDIDSDNDGIPDGKETARDSDGDGTSNYLDLDSDGDGILDSFEGLIKFRNQEDNNNDGRVDCSIDLNGNGLWDCIESAKGGASFEVPDTDGDGKADFLDLDSDGDGVFDRIELRGDIDRDGLPNYRDIDSDGDKIADAVEGASDYDGDLLPNYLDLDSDGDGLSDQLEGPTACVTCEDRVDNNEDGWDDRAQFSTLGWVFDTDLDKAPDFLDLDSDNDQLLDSIERTNDLDNDGMANFRDTDSDNDGILDTIEAVLLTKPVDTDGDSLADYEDVDADNDGLKDTLEALDFLHPVDTDKDGLADYRDVDSDQDGISDRLEAGIDLTKPLDSDLDLIPDYRDTDSDNDGMSDAVEAGSDPLHPKDSDADGVADYRDADSDNDGILDQIEVGPDPLIPLDSDKDGLFDYQDLDSDNDGLLDALEVLNVLKPVDTDKDGMPDYRDTDSDNDQIPDAVEAVNRLIPVDTDGDTIPDYRDVDSDGDKIPDAIEAGVNPLKPADTDADGKADYVDLDADNDTYLDAIETGSDPNRPVDTDKDGKYDFIDVDSDNDGILDEIENDINYGSMTDCDRDGVDNRIDGDVCAIFSPQGISPNGDGKNDLLVIPGILRMQPNHLTILNRWGQAVYEVDNYKNNWGGESPTSRNSFLSSDGRLPDGTYYYIIDFFGKYPTISTYLYIDRLK
jgi:gliding motility-associated-like protein